MKPPPPSSRAERLLRRLRAGGLDLTWSGLRAAALRAADQIQESAVEPLPALLAFSAVLGAVVILALDALMRPNAIAAHLNSVIVFVLTRELVPLVAALVLALRSGTALAVGLASASGNGGPKAPLKLTGELLPRAVGLVLSAVALTACMAAAALLGGYLIVALLGRIPVGVRLAAILAALSPVIIAVALSKAALAGLLVAAVSAVQGIRAAASPTSPGVLARAAGNGALQCALGCLILLVAVSLAPLAGAP